MTDIISRQKRSKLMSKVRSKNSSSEMTLRRLIHGLGYRYRLHVKDLPGTPDLVFPSKRSVIFMHGCFWHRHSECKMATMPKTRVEFWSDKFKTNRQRDKMNIIQLEKKGWRVLIIWECQIKKNNIDDVVSTVKQFLEGSTV